MKLKTIREQLLFAYDYHYQFAEKSLEDYRKLNAIKSVGYIVAASRMQKAKKDWTAHNKMALALDEALKLL